MQRWKQLVKTLALLIALWLVGRATLLIAGLIRTWACKSIWDARERWTSVRANAWLSLAWYLVAVLLHTQITTLWSRVSWLGAASIYPPISTNLLFRWAVALPLSPMLACLLESLLPKTARQSERILLPEEQAKLDKQRQPSNRKKRHSTAPTQMVPDANQSGRASALQVSPPPQHQSPQAKERRNLGTLWDLLPEDHPWKQTAIQEAVRQKVAQPSSAIPLVEQHGPPEQTAVPSPEGYNWDEGEGSLKLGGQ